MRKISMKESQSNKEREKVYIKIEWALKWQQITIPVTDQYVIHVFMGGHFYDQFKKLFNSLFVVVKTKQIRMWHNSWLMINIWICNNNKIGNIFSVFSQESFKTTKFEKGFFFEITKCKKWMKNKIHYQNIYSGFERPYKV